LNVAAAEKYSINVGGVIEIIVIAVRNAGNPASENVKKRQKKYIERQKKAKSSMQHQKKRGGRKRND
jgi:hypothetical protein